MQTTQCSERCKAIMLGDYRVGKSSLLNRINSTVGDSVRFGFLNIQLKKDDNREIDVQFFDTSGQERFGEMAPSYYRGPSLCVLCFDLTERKTFENLEKWIEKAQEHNSQLKFILVGTKLDKANTNRQVSSQDIEQLLSKILKGAPYFEVSSQTNENIELLRRTIANLIHLPEEKSEIDSTKTQPTTTIVNNYNIYCNIM